MEAISRYDNISEVAFFLFWWCFGGVFLRLEPMKRMTPATNLLLRTLIGKYIYFAKRRMLAENGSFYCYDQNLIRELSISRNTIRRARIFLKETGAIDYLTGRHKSAPTHYWVISKGAILNPFEQETKGPKMVPEGANLSVKKGQDCPQNISKEKREEKNNIPDPALFTEDEKEGIRAFAKSYGVEQTIKILSDKGCNPEAVQRIFEGVGDAENQAVPRQNNAQENLQ